MTWPTFFADVQVFINVLRLNRCECRQSMDELKLKVYSRILQSFVEPHHYYHVFENQKFMYVCRCYF